MFIPIDERGNWITISIYGYPTICLFQSAGEVLEAADTFQPGLKVKSKAIDLAIWEQTLTEAMNRGVLHAVEFLVLGAPNVTPIDDMVEDVRKRLVRKLQYALRQPPGRKPI